MNEFQEMGRKELAHILGGDVPRYEKPPSQAQRQDAYMRLGRKNAGALTGRRKNGAIYPAKPPGAGSAYGIRF